MKLIKFVILFIFINSFNYVFGSSTADISIKSDTKEKQQVMARTTAELHLSFSEVIKRASPSVVNIFAKKVEKQSASFLFDDPFFNQFFNMEPSERVRRSLGSAVIIDAKKGWVLTNAHVINNAKEIKIHMEEESFDAYILWQDNLLDLAIIKFEDVPENLKALELGNSDDLEVGDIVLAIGNPFGLGKTVTMGIVSALDRQLKHNFGRYIQTDAAINPGNSGGALITTDGRLIGLNTMIVSKSGGSQGLGFASPANLLNNILQQIDDNGIRQRFWFGIGYKTFKRENIQGAIIDYIDGNNKIAKSNLKVGDIIVAVDGQKIGSAADIMLIENYATQDSQIELELISGTKVTLNANKPKGNLNEGALQMQDNGIFDGTTLINRSPLANIEYGLNQDTNGVIISEIKSNSIAKRMGFMVGDVIHEVNGHKITQTDEMKKISLMRTNKWRVTVQRGGRLTTFTFRF